MQIQNAIVEFRKPPFLWVWGQDINSKCRMQIQNAIVEFRKPPFLGVWGQDINSKCSMQRYNANILQDSCLGHFRIT
jgi:hypothetical protein